MIELLLYQDASEYGDWFHEKMNGHSALDAAVNGMMGPSNVDEIELRVLKWTLYGGAKANQLSCFTKFCLPWEQAHANPTNASRAGFESETQGRRANLPRHCAMSVVSWRSRLSHGRRSNSYGYQYWCSHRVLSSFNQTSHESHACHYLGRLWYWGAV
jgi:hypothetical protein